MNISLTPEMERFIHKQVKTGRYQTASEVVRDALRGLEIQEAHLQARLAQFKAEVQKGIDDANAGRLRPFDMEEIRRGGRKLLAARKKARSK